MLSLYQVNAQHNLNQLLKNYNSGAVPYISVQELRMYQLNSEIIVLDAREREEFQVSHLPDAIFAGYDSFDVSVLDTIPKDRKIAVYCSLGIRSENIAERISQKGFSKVKNLYGGIIEWKNENFPVIDSLGKETQKVHVYSRKWSKWLKNGEKIY